ncbi:histone deacetylase [Candidatus Woesearchaeota archaeon CG11_big_fil_rev_8_21_14_0_20_43_8]|nr:MAG: histone deacetylase [Candidatus Woesearchaeota archaeon CG11_big_fil_rev_8_21_14_0_20_43_8]PIO08907.1 MAG: histone deacetylase [Candidatus Woesearchaeota archaeon CG08_land_8_20_14_0_20_43_7]
MRTAIVYSKCHVLHHDSDHPENARRVESILKKIDDEDLILIKSPGREASRQELELVHEEDFIDFVFGLDSLEKKDTIYATGMLTKDNYFSDDTPKAAIASAGCVLSAVDLMMSGKADNAFALCRPPGHHAEASGAMGFCFFNNIAVGARYAYEKYDLKKIFILDLDAHHGNGTQHIFERRDEVFYCSIHQYPLFPGTGRDLEIGYGNGVGLTLNIPLPPGSGEDDYMRVMSEKVIPSIESFMPDMILVSAGFDTHRLDPLTDMMLKTASYGKITRLLKDTAKRFCSGRLLYVLEGGYDLYALADSAVCVLRELQKE